jgi:hypothetical protein
MAAPVIAAGIGALASIGSAAFSASQARKESERQAKQAERELAAREAAKKKAGEYISSWETEASKILDEAEANGIQLSSPGGIEAYRQMRASYDPARYAPEFERFDKSQYNVEDYLNPQREAILKDVAAGIQHTASGAGLGHSSGAISAISRGIVDKDESLYDKAYERMLGERNFDYGAYTDYINQQQQRLDRLQQGELSQMEQMRGDIMFDQQQQDARLANRLGLGNALMQSRAQLI